MNHFTRSTLCTALASMLGAPVLAQTTWYVDVNGVPPGTGTQLDPYVSIADAHAAATTVDGDTLSVAPGVYVEGTLDLTKRIAVVGTGGPEQNELRDTFVTLGVLFQSEPSASLEGFTISHSAQGLHPSTRLVNVKSGTLRRCILRDTAFTALFVDHTAFVDQCTIAGNYHPVTGFPLGWYLNMSNSIVWGNTLGSDTPDGGNVKYNAGQIPLLWGDPGVGNLPGDPGFWSLTLGDYRLRTGSPCIDTGDPASPLDGDGTVTDMGALPHDSSYIPEAYSFCSTAVHSTGAGALMSMDGTRSISANDFTLLATACPPGKVGIFYYGPNQIQASFGDGFRCVGGMTQRLYPAVFADGAGTAERGVDFTQHPVNSGSSMIQAGSTWKFQFWFRDPMGPGGTGSNLSDGLSASFLP